MYFLLLNSGGNIETQIGNFHLIGKLYPMKLAILQFFLIYFILFASHSVPRVWSELQMKVS